MRNSGTRLEPSDEALLVSLAEDPAADIESAEETPGRGERGRFHFLVDCAPLNIRPG
ncbi:MAG: hypothetical protein QOH23_713 [Gaiellaceae bacterium]|jgi:hypothetical protein|nr:hypothetical protein [Gaiellaceae bacterium]